MKTTIISFGFIFILMCMAPSLLAQHEGHSMSGNQVGTAPQSQAKPAAGKTESFKVYGNCASCKKRIETAAMMVPGVKSALWDSKTKMLEVTYKDSLKTDEVKKAIAKVGHDSDKYKASDAAYNALPACCHYRD